MARKTYGRKGERFPQPPAGHRDWYAYEALQSIPRIVTMLDRNPYSSSYGCFDREFWHYRTVDFPCGMSQEFCLPLALVVAHDLPHNPWYRNERLKQLVEASIEFSIRASHADGSTDDYFPYERALGAHVFSTYAMTEACIALDITRPDFIDFFRLRGDWLREHNETGQLANHQAFAALALYNVYLLTGDHRFREASDGFVDLTLSWQHQEGWFQEYEGADPGYHSCSIAFLGKLWQKSGDDRLLEPLGRAVEFASYFQHPDGSYGGEYGSRNTYHFYPHGFELLAPHFPTAGRIVETYLQRSLPERRRYFNDDNRMMAHYVYDWIQSWLDYAPERPEALHSFRPPFQRWFPDARIFVKQTPDYYAVVNLSKGGVLKVFDQEGPVYSDTGLFLRADDGTVLCQNIVADNPISVDLDLSSAPDTARVSVAGPMQVWKRQLSSPVKQMAFRGMNLTVGRFPASANLVRATRQKILITGKAPTKLRFERSVELGEGITVTDTLDASGDTHQFSELRVEPDATSIYVANSCNFQESVLLPSQDLSAHCGQLNNERHLRLERRIVAPAPRETGGDS